MTWLKKATAGASLVALGSRARLAGALLIAALLWAGFFLATGAPVGP